MGIEKYEAFVRRAQSTLTYDPGWSRENLTGAWRAERPVLDPDLCNSCGICWLFCPDAAIARSIQSERSDPQGGWDPTALPAGGGKRFPPIQIDYRYCKGCGICAEECRIGAISMVLENTEKSP